MANTSAQLDPVNQKDIDLLASAMKISNSAPCSNDIVDAIPVDLKIAMKIVLINATPTSSTVLKAVIDPGTPWEGDRRWLGGGLQGARRGLAEG